MDDVDFDAQSEGQRLPDPQESIDLDKFRDPSEHEKLAVILARVAKTDASFLRPLPHHFLLSAAEKYASQPAAAAVPASPTTPRLSTSPEPPTDQPPEVKICDFAAGVKEAWEAKGQQANNCKYWSDVVSLVSDLDTMQVSQQWHNHRGRLRLLAPDWLFLQSLIALSLSFSLKLVLHRSEQVRGPVQECV